MKELSIEEKAKAYDEALERARKEYEIYKGVKDVFHCEALERIFHKLAESEDKKMRNAVIGALKDTAIAGYDNYDVEDLIAWLENQGEQKPQIKLVFPKFRVGDIIQHIPLKKWDTTKKITHIDETGYYFDYSHQGDTISRGFIGFSFENDYELVEQKPAWSEGDDKMLDSIIEEVHYIGDFPDYPTKEENELYDECLAKVDWLKSLKARYTWKPSDEQMLVMEYIKNCFDFSKPSYREIFISVYKQLKAL